MLDARRRCLLACDQSCTCYQQVSVDRSAEGISSPGQCVPPHMKPFTESERQEFLAGVHVGVLSIAATDGRPPASVPIWYGYTPGENILVNTGAGSRKTRLIEQAGVVTLAAQREEPPYQYVVVEGTVVE